MTTLLPPHRLPYLNWGMEWHFLSERTRVTNVIVPVAIAIVRDA